MPRREGWSGPRLRFVALALYMAYLATFLALGLVNKLGEYKAVGFGLLFVAALCALLDSAVRTSWRQVLLIYGIAVAALPAVAVAIVTLLHQELIPSQNGGAYAFLYAALFLLPNTVTFGAAWLAAQLLPRGGPGG